MKIRYFLQSKAVLFWSTFFPESYKKFSIKGTIEKNDLPASNTSKPLNSANVALLTSSGVHLNSDRPFDVESDGDYTFRIIPAHSSDQELTATHLYYDTKTAKKDISIVFPLQTLKEIQKDGMIGSVSNLNIGVNGGTLKPEPHEDTATQVAQKLKEGKVDILLLTPG
ncbi:glycine/sarcosine/betaine reductase selenoprotein B family protein [Piscibacillus halophilus]|uniref:D-proline reductase (Dithiol) PrdB n=1 Tax=Piscibacillus halophilus TaxID=571933 RepID=A0A1H9CFK8_9BACI|nr:glycine/sarcosine/betaine reductase selenoprotein B family protein [Piscibacillus halophilus]SEP99821.1 D-proline reductase (dithiol) PrdB [Piscibacillus halophilus]